MSPTSGSAYMKAAIEEALGRSINCAEHRSALGLALEEYGQLIRDEEHLAMRGFKQGQALLKTFEEPSHD